MSKTLDEIKKRLEEELPVHYHIDREPRLTPRQYMELQWLHKDALALVQQLEAQNAELSENIKWMEAEQDDLKRVIRQLQVERDAAVKDIDLNSRCHACKKFFKNGGECSGGIICISRRFEWRGVQKEE